MHSETAADWDWDSVLLLTNLPWDDDGRSGSEGRAGNSGEAIPLQSDADSNRNDPRLSCPNYLAGRVPCACTDNEDENENEGGRKRIKSSARCQVSSCGASLAGLKGYHQRHRVCLTCANANTVMLESGPHRYCQQCGKFHILLDFDEGKRSCRRKLERHNNRRRRKIPDIGITEVSQSSDKETKSGSSPLNDLSGACLDGKSASPALVEQQNLETSATRDIQTDEQHSSLTPSAITNAGDVQSVEPLQNDLPFREHSGNGLSDSQFDNQILDKGGSKSPGLPREGIVLNETSSAVTPKVGEQFLNCNKSGPGEQSLLGLLMEDRMEFDNPPHCQRSTSQDHFSEMGRAVHPSSVSSTGFRRQSTYISPCPTRRISFKFYDWNPADFPRRLRQQILEWLANMPVELEGYIRSGCIILTLFVAMSQTSWDKASADWSHQLLQLVCQSESGFWDKGFFIARLDDQVSEVDNGKVSVTVHNDGCFNPILHHVRPLCLEAGVQAEVSVFGQNLQQKNARLVISSAGKCISHDVSKSLLCKRDPFLVSHSKALQDCTCSICIPFLAPRNFGTVYIEFEGPSGTSNFLPVLIADKEICSEIRTLEQELCMSKMTLDTGTNKALSQTANDLVLDLGWVLRLTERQGIERIHMIGHLERLRRLFMFSVRRGWYSISKRLLQVAKMIGLLEDVGISEDGFTALHLAALHNHVNLARLLVMVGSEYEQGVDFICMKGFWWHADFPGPENITPLHIVGLREGAGTLVDTLTKSEVQRGILAWEQAKDCHGKSPSHYAMLICTSYHDIVRQNALLLMKSIGHSENTILSNVSSCNERRISVQSVVVAQQQTHSKMLADGMQEGKQGTRNCFCGKHFGALFQSVSTHNHNEMIETRRLVVTTVSILVLCAGLCIVLQHPDQIVQISTSLRRSLGSQIHL
ncbi:hypothetical protein O6H91_14G048700 [Diphasiastrum complanatum]|uniref:Uncharacterized protein n=1 Tax=Diphasiastrum complanatum TaxID=34168 RepID=A0ACC2BP35_DIPCM|nr:hypothetical protein O6H91_14G048700 [Diphasiastrum complanatum]